jgi:hypothetical protein
VTTGDGPRTERVVLVEEEVVVRGRTRRVSFRVRVNDGWVPAKRHETARSEPLSRGPGIVFRIRVELSLPLGTLIERTDAEAHPEHKSALDHLVSARRGTRGRVTRTRLVVQRGGELKSDSAAGK